MFFCYDITFGTVARLSVWATEEIWIDSRQGQQMLLFSETSRPALRPSKLHINGYGDHFFRGKAAGACS